MTRALLLDTTERVMVLEGYAAVTTRRVAKEVDLTAALVHYYFPTTDDLLLAAYRRATDRYHGRIQEALASLHPLLALWNVFTDKSQMALGVEFMALANHRKIIRKEIVRHDERCRKFQVEALASTLAQAGVDPRRCPPSCAIMLLEGISRSFVMEQVLGITFAHAETKAFVERLLGELENSRRRARGRGASAPRQAGRRGQKRAACAAADEPRPISPQRVAR